MLKIIPFTYNNDPDELLSNTYVIVDSDNNTLVVDPSKNNDNLKNYLIKNNLNLKAILLTHGHYDHFSGVERLINEFKVDIYCTLDGSIWLDNYKDCQDTSKASRTVPGYQFQTPEYSDNSVTFSISRDSLKEKAVIRIPILSCVFCSILDVMYVQLAHGSYWVSCSPLCSNDMCLVS